MGSPSLRVEPHAPPSFGYGDCADAAIGTVLTMRGCNDPTVLLFRNLAFYPERSTGPAGQPLFRYRRDDLLESELTTELDVLLVEHRFAEPHLALAAAMSLGARGRLPILQVDHFYYEPSHLRGVRHLPHKILLTSAAGGAAAYLDPFPAFARAGTTGPDELRAWMGPELLLAIFELHSPERIEFDADVYLRSTGEAAVRANVAAMEEVGFDALEALACHLEDWVDSGAPASTPAPIFGLYDLGAARLGHAHWLRKLAKVSDASTEILMQAAELVEDAGRRWNVLNSLRAMHDRIKETEEPSRRFIHQKVGTFPTMVRRIARVESAAIDALKQRLLLK